MKLDNLIDIKENQLLKLDKKLLEILLKDKTTGKNILWATDNYSWFGKDSPFNTEDEINKTWQASTEKISFSNERNKTWQDYVKAMLNELAKKGMVILERKGNNR